VFLHDRQLSATFGDDHAKRVLAPLESLYRRYYDETWQRYAELTVNHGGRLDDPPQFHVVHSPKSYPHNIRSAGEVAIIYDQHLGQVFNRLTALTLEDASPALVDCYLQKLFAQRCYVVGDFDSAALFGSVAYLMKSNLKNDKQQSPALDAMRSVLVGLQERFVIAHELAHTALGSSEELLTNCEWLFGNLVTDYYDLREESGASLSEAEANSQFWDDVDAAFMRRNPGATIPEEAKLAARSQKPTARSGAERETEQRLRADPLLRREFLCDSLAATSLLTGSKDLSEVIAAFVASTAALHNLRLLKILDGHIESADTDGNANFLTHAQDRLSLLRAMANAYMLFVLPAGKEHQPELHRSLTGWNKDFAAVVNDQLLFHFHPKTMRPHYLKTLGAEFFTIADQIATDPADLRMLLGFS